MTEPAPIQTYTDIRSRYLRPIKLSILLSISGEAILFVVWGLILFPGGSVINKLLWTIVFCGLGMGGAVGAMIALFVVDRAQGVAAILLTTLLATLMLGVACNYLCLQLDQTFLYFGGSENGVLFVAPGVAMSALAGAAIGWLCFTERGRSVGRTWLD